MFVPVNEPIFFGNEKKYLSECIDTGFVADGPFNKRFEEAFANHLGVEFASSVSNGTTALEVGLFSIGISKGDEVILPSFTIVSCVAAILRLGAIPVLVDVDDETLNINPGEIESKITERTKAIMVVHIYGHPCDMDPILELARKHDLQIIEDNAEAHGAEYKGQKCGTFGKVSTFSFYANKHITTGEGGMVVTSDEFVFERAKYFKNLCFEEDRFHHNELGYNFRMSNLQSAVGLAQLENFEIMLDKKIRLGEKYRENLNDIQGIRLQGEKSWAKQVFWVYTIRIEDDLNINAKEAMRLLGKEGIGTRPFFKGMHMQPVFHKLGLFKNSHFPVTERAYEKGFYIPSGLNLTDDQVDYVSEKVRNLFLNYQ